MKSDKTKHDAEQFTYDLKIVGKMIGMSDKQVFRFSKRPFPTTIQAKLLEIEDTD